MLLIYGGAGAGRDGRYARRVTIDLQQIELCGSRVDYALANGQCFEYVWATLRVHVQNMFGVCLGHIRWVVRACLAHDWVSFGGSVLHVWCMFGDDWGMCCVCLGMVQECLRCVWYVCGMFEIYLGDIWDILEMTIA